MNFAIWQQSIVGNITSHSFVHSSFPPHPKRKAINLFCLSCFSLNQKNSKINTTGHAPDFFPSLCPFVRAFFSNFFAIESGNQENSIHTVKRPHETLFYIVFFSWCHISFLFFADTLLGITEVSCCTTTMELMEILGTLSGNYCCAF